MSEELIFRNPVGRFDAFGGLLQRCLLYTSLGIALLAHRIDNLGSGTYEHQIIVGTGTCKFGVLGQKAVTGMDRFASTRDCSTDDASIVEIALGGRSRSNANALVSLKDSCSIRIRLGIRNAALHALSLIHI